MKFLRKLPPLGLRVVKTALAVLAVLFIYGFWGRQGAVLAAVAAVICMQGSVSGSVKSGLNRILGTVLGGVFGVLVSLIPYHKDYFALWALVVAAGLVPLMYLCNLISKPESIIIACVVYLVIAADIMYTGDVHPVQYALQRLLDTGIGVVVAVAVNVLVFRPRKSP